MTKEQLQAKKDLRCVYRTISLLKDVIKNAPDHFDCESEAHEIALCVISCMELIKIARALRAFIDEEPNTK